MNYMRPHGRLSNQRRVMSVQHNVFGYAPSSVLLTVGNTKVLCSVTMQNGVPPFLRGKGAGWLTAEYAMLPTATQERSAREIIQMSRSGRSSEISRFISRVLRTIVDLRALGERTIIVDCDILQADGGTRAASITAASIALSYAQQTWLANRSIHAAFLTDAVAAISVGVLDGQVLLDPDYAEDAMLQADFNIVLTQSGNLIELQGGAEKQSIDWKLFDAVLAVARTGISQVFAQIHNSADHDTSISIKPIHGAPLFSLQNRIKLAP